MLYSMQNIVQSYFHYCYLYVFSQIQVFGIHLIKRQLFPCAISRAFFSTVANILMIQNTVMSGGLFLIEWT